MSSKKINEAENFLTIQEVAEILRCCPTTIYRTVARGALPSTKIGGKLLIRRSAVDALVAQGERACVPAPAQARGGAR